MINTSNEYKQVISGSRVFYAGAKIIPVIGTIPDLTNADIVSLKIDDETSKSGSFQIGSARINKLTLVINNDERQFDGYDFTDAVIRPSIGLQLSETIETLKKGVFTVDDSKAVGSTIIITALDNMNKFDTEFSNVTQAFPCTTLQLLQSVCLHCGVILSTVSFLNSDFTIERRPSDEATTCREIVAWIGQLSGNFARCNVDGALELKWYDIGAFENEVNIDGGVFDEDTPYSSGDNVDGGNFTDYSSGDNIDGGTFLDMKRYHHIYSLGSATIGTDDVVITGIQVKAMGTESDYGETVLFGSKGYAIEITDNPLITENKASIIANSVGAKIVGMRFRPCSISAIADPSREGGDVAKLSHKGNTYQILLTNVSSQIGSNDNISCDAETPSKKKSVRFDAGTKTIVEARKIVKEEISAYDQVQQYFNNLVFHSFGLFYTKVEQEDKSVIEYGHDKPTLAESTVIWKQTRDAFVYSNDGGVNWKGMDKDGNILANVLTAIGVNAEWINVLTSFTVGTQFSVDKFGKLVASNVDLTGRVTANSGKFGPFDISSDGIFSNFIELYESGANPLLWMMKPGIDGESFDDNSEGSGKANYEPDVAVVRSILNGIETNVILHGRDDGNETIGQLLITKRDVSTDETISEITVNDTDGINIKKYSGGIMQSENFLTEGALQLEKDGFGAIINIGSDGTLDISADNVSISGNVVNVNGTEF